MELELKEHKRSFLPENLKIQIWSEIQPFFKDLAERNIDSAADLYRWFKDRSELEAAISEELGWRYIRMTCDTENQEKLEQFNYFISEIQPQIAPYSNQLDLKALSSPFLNEINENGFSILKRNIKKEADIFREENIPLITEIETKAQQYGAVSGGMTVEIDGKELTLQQASDYLQKTDRVRREEAWRKIAARRLQDQEKLDDLFDELIKLRHQVALNAGFSNYRDYMFKAMGRFDYTPQDCFTFHNAVKKVVVPILNDLTKERKEALKLDQLRPWDLNVNYFGDKPLKPFADGKDLLEKSVSCFEKIDSYAAGCLRTMGKLGHLDLESRKGKAPGGYNYPLDEIGIPFIFMNATSSLRDLVTMVHEGGHAIHSFVTRDLALNFYKHPPSEVAELASMSMELISMEHWEIFFENEEDLHRAKREHLEGIIQTLPWVALIDAFQHWIYENPSHTRIERAEKWKELYSDFNAGTVDWSGLEEIQKFIWQKQLHLFEVPFYYIEYGFAQLGAVAVWKKYLADNESGFKNYLQALKAGYTKTIPEVYQEAGIQFDFSEAYIRELMGLVKEKI